MLNKFKSYLLILLVLCFASYSFVQGNITVTGSVVNKVTNKPIAGAHIWVNNKAVGTISDDNGAFRIRVAKGAGNQIVISDRGMKNAYLEIDELNTATSQRVALEAYGLVPEADKNRLMAIETSEVFDKAVKNLKLNKGYPKEKFELSAFYRELQSQNDQYSSLVEAYVKVQDNRITQVMDEVEITSKGKVYGNFDEKDEAMAVDYFGSFNLMINLINGHTMNVVQHATRIRPGKKNESGWGNREYNLKEITYYQGRLAYVLEFVVGDSMFETIIDAENYVFLRNEFKYAASDTEDTKKYIWKEDDEVDTECGLSQTWQIFEFKLYEGVLYPFYFARHENRGCYSVTNNNFVWKDAASRELLFYDVATTDIKAFTNPMDKDRYVEFSTYMEATQPADLEDVNFIRNSKFDDLGPDEFLKLKVD